MNVFRISYFVFRGSVFLLFLLPAVGFAEQQSNTAAPALGSPSGMSAGSAMAQEAEYDFGDYTSQTLTTKAWDALNLGEYDTAEVYAAKCLELYETQALEQATQLTDFATKEEAFSYWALNDVATCYFILGQVRLAQGRIQEGQQAFNTIIEKFPFAQCWDTRGWFWKVAEAASDKLTTIGTPYDFGDYTSETLTTKAWDALNQDDHQGVEVYVKKCINLYETEAKAQQAQLTDFATKDKAFSYWALNDVATCHFILGESLLKQKRYDEAKAAFERVINDFSFAQCWDPKGWFWKVAVGARDRLNKILVLSGN
ncbi:MAG: tetratricopeptide repeat protein [Candidatus Omnitrophica bacterium]|nr:tetratricopeptide repeat protein [Candidatus Omnitrophota bacterium]